MVPLPARTPPFPISISPSFTVPSRTRLPSTESLASYFMRIVKVCTLNTAFSETVSEDDAGIIS